MRNGGALRFSTVQHFLVTVALVFPGLLSSAKDIGKQEWKKPLCFGTTNTSESIVIPIAHNRDTSSDASIIHAIAINARSAPKIWLETAPKKDEEPLSSPIWDFPVEWKERIHDKFISAGVLSFYSFSSEHLAILTPDDLLTISSDYCARMISSGNWGERNIANAAKIAGLEVAYLESAEQQHLVYSESSGQDKAEMAWAFLTNCGAFNASAKTLLASLNDSSSLTSALEAYERAMRQIGAKLLVNDAARRRDAHLKAELMAALHSPGVNVVFVGASHLPTNLVRSSGPGETCKR